MRRCGDADLKMVVLDRLKWIWSECFLINLGLALGLYSQKYHRTYIFSIFMFCSDTLVLHSLEHVNLLLVKTFSNGEEYHEPHQQLRNAIMRRKHIFTYFLSSMRGADSDDIDFLLQYFQNI